MDFTEIEGNIQQLANSTNNIIHDIHRIINKIELFADANNQEAQVITLIDMLKRDPMYINNSNRSTVPARMLVFKDFLDQHLQYKTAAKAADPIPLPDTRRCTPSIGH